MQRLSSHYEVVIPHVLLPDVPFFKQCTAIAGVGRGRELLHEAHAAPRGHHGGQDQQDQPGQDHHRYLDNDGYNVVYCVKAKRSSLDEIFLIREWRVD